MGANEGGFVFYVQGGRLAYGYNYVAQQRFKVQSDARIPEGEHVFSLEFTPTGEPDFAKGMGVPANIRLYVDGKPAGGGDLPVTIPLSLGLSGGASVGADVGSPVMPDYASPFRFTGAIRKVLVDLSGEEIEDKEAKAKAYLAKVMARQ